MIKLYQFPISHFCEKVRWALDFKGLTYETKNLLPGPHLRTTLKLCEKSSVPILLRDEDVIQNSLDILSYLDEAFPQKSLTPTEDSLKEEALEWEKELDNLVGRHLRRYLYHTLLEYPSIVISFFCKDGPWYGRAFYKIAFPKLRKKMRGFMKINSETAEESREIVQKMIDRLNQIYKKQKFLVGDGFSRADLTAAALLAPVFQPEHYGLDWPNTLPEPLQSFASTNSQKLLWAQEFYSTFR